MKKTKLDLILHPLRLRIISELGAQKMTTGDLARIMPDVPQATLYRHINALAEGGVLEIVAEEQIRGTVQKTYAVVEGSTQFDEEELAEASKEDLHNMFNVLMTTLIGDFNHYLTYAPQPMNVAEDGGWLTKQLLFCTSDEIDKIGSAIQDVVKPLRERDDKPDERYMISFIAFPYPYATKDEDA